MEFESFRFDPVASCGSSKSDFGIEVEIEGEIGLKVVAGKLAEILHELFGKSTSAALVGNG